MKYRLLLIPIGILTASIAFLGCSSAPKVNTEGKIEISAHLANDKDFLKKSISNTDNPFFVPMRVMDVFSSKREFVPIKIDLSLPQTSLVTLEASVKDVNGDVVAVLCTKSQVYSYWTNTTASDDEFLPKKKMVLDWYYPSDSTFTAKTGKREYFIACLSKKAIQRPASVDLSVTVGDNDPEFFTFDLLPEQKKKGDK